MGTEVRSYMSRLLHPNLVARLLLRLFDQSAYLKGCLGKLIVFFCLVVAGHGDLVGNRLFTPEILDSFAATRHRGGKRCQPCQANQCWKLPFDEVVHDPDPDPEICPRRFFKDLRGRPFIIISKSLYSPEKNNQFAVNMSLRTARGDDQAVCG